MKDTVTVEDTLIGATAINAMITKTHRDRMNAEKLEKVLLDLGVKSLGKDGRGYKFWSSIAVSAVIPQIRKIIEDEKSPAERPAKQESKTDDDYANLIADMDHRVSLILSDVLDETVEKVAQMHAGNQMIFKNLVENDKKRQEEHEAVMRNLMDVTTGLAAILGKLNEPAIEKKPASGALMPDVSTQKEPPFTLKTQEQPPQPKQRHRPHIGIIGITPPATTQIDKEFCEAFKITMLGPNDSHKIVNLRWCDRVFTLRGKVMSRHINELKNIGQKPFGIGDSVSKIRDALTAYYIEVTDDKEAA